MTIAEKYRKILEKPMPEPFKGYIEELLAHIEGGQTLSIDAKPITTRQRSQKVTLIDESGFMPKQEINL